MVAEDFKNKGTNRTIMLLRKCGLKITAIKSLVNPGKTKLYMKIHRT